MFSTNLQQKSFYFLSDSYMCMRDCWALQKWIKKKTQILKERQIVIEKISKRKKEKKQTINLEDNQRKSKKRRTRLTKNKQVRVRKKNKSYISTFQPYIIKQPVLVVVGPQTHSSF